MASSFEQDTFRDEVEELSGSVERGPRTEGVFTVLRGENPGALYTMEGEEAVIGRSPDAAISIPDESLSRRHARVLRLGLAYAIEDLGSTNGTFVDGQRVCKPHVLEDGARIFLGVRTVLHFRLHDRVELEAARTTLALTLRDPLTGVFNRRHLQERLWAEAAYARRHRTPLSLIFLDIDHFKHINDTYGHAAGDVALRLVADTLTGLTRKEDVIARFGGEEFALLARGIDREGALVLGERIRESIAAQSLPTHQGPMSFTVSVGVAHTDGQDNVDPHHLFDAADRALYAAKAAGRNTVSFAPGAA